MVQTLVTDCVLLTTMERVFHALRIRFFRSDHELLFFEDELSRLTRTIKALVEEGESTSLLILGRRGAGKKRLLIQALKNAKKDANVGENLLEVHLNGLIHTDDRSALRSMAQQLHREALLDSCPTESSTSGSDVLKSQPFSQQLQWFLDGLRAGNGSSKSLLIILQEFDLFALHRNQILLYNLFDCCQCNETPVCVIGLSCRLDIMELLEKRVKSRFSHRQIHLVSIASPTDHTSSYADGNSDGDSETKSPAFENYCLACKHMLTLSSEYVHSLLDKPLAIKERRELESCVSVWNRHVIELMSDEIVVDSLRQAWSVSVSLRRLANLLIPIVTRLGPSKIRIEPVEFIDSLCLLRQDAKVNSLKGLCILELFLITALVKLQEIHEGETVNFEMVYSGYTKFCRSNCPGYLYDKAVMYKLLDSLIDLELVVTGKAAVSAAATTVDRRSMMTGATSLPNYRPLFCFVDTSVLSACLDAYPNCPVELRFWIHSRTF
ncbi:hypothetical protein P879_03402 [Paragonimus westermani]|uniref:Origin recognition complex subunit 4 n=1 Tax=Paragonimus westermani TaxID=34504 RepID=A0A8T0DJU4_9TREM|nr:hypothetical protein P879_03402 [Paragonimus westermani]